MVFYSILFEKAEGDIKKETPEAPLFFADLNLDQIIDAITTGKEEYDLKPFFYTSLKDVDAIKYRQEIMRDLENEVLFEYIKSFAEKMREMCRYLALVDTLYYKYHKQGWFLEAVETYCEAINCLANDLSLADLKSRGLLTFREYLTNYAASGRFTSLMTDTKKLKADLATVKYCLIIKGNRIKVRKYESEIDYSEDVEKTFERFQQGAVKDYRAKLPIESGMNHVEAGILDLVAKLYFEIFLNLDNYCANNRGYLDETIAVFDREIQFYIAYLEYIAKIKQAGLKFCYPQITVTSKNIHDYEGVDLALANKLISEGSPVVCNDFS
jgi:DNA mismatch repair protein MutS